MNASCKDVVGFVGGSNTRNRMRELSEKGFVAFPSELTKNEEGNVNDDRDNLYDLVYGANADDKSKARFLKLIEDFDSVGPDSSYAIAKSFLQHGQRQQCTVRKTENDQYELIGGYGRWLGAIVANLLDPAFSDEISVDVMDITNDEAKRLSSVLNLTSRRLKPSDEGKIYHELRKQKMSAKEVANHLNVVDKKGKLNTARVQLYSDLWSEHVTDKERIAVDNGTMTMEKILAKVKERRMEKTKKEGKKHRGPQAKAQKVLKYDVLMEIYKNDEVIDYFVKEKENDFNNFADAMRFGMRIALGQEKVPTDNELKALLELEEVIG